MIDKEIIDLVNKIVWWIPFKGKRNNLRNALIEKINCKCNNYTLNKYDKIIYDYIDILLNLKCVNINEKLKKDIFELSKNNIYFYDYDKYNDFIYLRKENLNFVTDSYNQIIIKEVFCNDLYNIEKYIDINNKYTFIDIGCNRGYTTLFYAKKYYCNKIYSFEIVNNIFKYALKNIELNEDIKNKVLLYNFGISNYDGKVKVAYCPFHDSVSSINSDAIDYLVNNESVEYVESEVRDFSKILGDIIKDNPKENIVIKIDTEGSEYKIFESLFNNEILFKQIKLFIGEFHFGTNGIDKKLEDLGFISYITGRDFIFYRPDQTRPDQTRPE